MERKQKCYGCGKTDHKIRDCKLVQQKAAVIVEDQVSSGSDKFQNSSRGYNTRGRGRNRGRSRGFDNYRRSGFKSSEKESIVSCCINRNQVLVDDGGDENDEVPVMSRACRTTIADVNSFNK